MSRFYAYTDATCGLSGLDIKGGREIEVEGQVAHLNGTTVFYLVGIEGQDGKPTPASQLEVLREEERSDGIVTVRETVGTGWTPVPGTGTPKRQRLANGRWVTKNVGCAWTLKSIVARRTFAYATDATKEEREAVKASAIYRDGLGREVRVWCRLVREDAAKGAGFKVPTRHLENNRRQGARDVGHEDASVPQAQRTASHVAETRARTVEVATASQNVPNGADVEWRE